ncbi:hypothetical protein B0H14DRAFT_1166091 [Mycena olivaceomarginata]|nr:hypothetical protein B0H14DRAFT_1166091 [Mycena olivaceomarginata]
MKAVLDTQGRPYMFRLQESMQCLVTSVARMGLSPFDPDAFLACDSKCRGRGAPDTTLSDHSLCIRPTIVGTKPTIKVGASE